MAFNARTVMASGGTTFSIKPMKASVLCPCFLPIKNKKGNARQKNITIAITTVSKSASPESIFITRPFPSQYGINCQGKSDSSQKRKTRR